MVSLTLRSINRYPVKSCRGEAMDAARVDPWGLAEDRRWMLVDPDGAQVTAREHPRLLLVTPRLRAGGGLDVTSPDAPDLRVDAPSVTDVARVSVWGSELDAACAADAANDWFSALIEAPVRLVHLADTTQRRPNPRFAAAGDRVNLADGYPILVTTHDSLAAINDAIASGPNADEGPVPMVRFRPNLVVSGGTAWDEDGWRSVRIGAATFRAVKGCDRCVMTTLDPETAAKGKEPIAALARTRRWDGATWFGAQLIPDSPGEIVTVGDEVEILEAVDAPDGPPR